MEDSGPDFQDLLAAFDIPDMKVKITEVRSLAPVTSASAPGPEGQRAVQPSPPALAATVKQEPEPPEEKEPAPWQRGGGGSGGGGGGDAGQGVAAESPIEVVENGDSSGETAASSASEKNLVMNGAAVVAAADNSSSASGFFKPLRELVPAPTPAPTQAPTQAPSSQHAKVVSSTLIANSWVNVAAAAAASKSTAAAVSSTSKPSKADKPVAVPTALIRYTRPVSSPASSSVTTAITASVRLSLVSSAAKSAAPPLIVASRSLQPAKPKMPAATSSSSSSPPNKSDDNRSKNAAQLGGTVNPQTGFTVLRISSADLLKRNNPIPNLVPPSSSSPNSSSSSPSSSASSSNNHLKMVQEGRVTKVYKTTRQACQECGDTFLAESSLRLHMERRSVQIAFRCDFCFSRNRLLFYNKCSYYAHLRRHSRQLRLRINYSSQADNATVSSLTYTKPPLQPVGQSPSQPVVVVSEVVKSSLSGETAAGNGSSTSSCQQSSSAAKEAANGQPPSGAGSAAPAATAAAPSTLAETDCHLCNSKFATQEALQTHMQRYQAALESTCDHCRMTLPNKCQLRAHSIMHMSSPVFWTCPECARRFSSLKTLFHHVANTCMHWYRQLRTRCKLCSRMVQDYEQHLDKGHEMLFYRCVSCSMAFKTLPALKEHSERRHKVQPGSPLCRIISKCPFCETVFMQKPLLQAHIRMHIGQESPYKGWVYSCPKCSIKISLSLDNFKKHMALSHPSLKHLHCDFCRHNFQSYAELRLHFQTGKLPDSPETPTDKACKVVKFRRTKHCKDSLTDSGAGDDDSDDKEKSSASSLPAASTGTTAADGKAAEGQPLSKLYVKKTRSCPGCRKNGKSLYFFREEDLRTHMAKVHPDMKLSSLNSDEGIKYVTIRPRDGEDKLPAAKKTEDKSGPAAAPPPAAHSGKRSEESARAAPARKRPKLSLPTEFTCASADCGHQSRSRSAFRAHIEGHRSDRSLSQCQECGTCFRIKAAVRRHLFIQHGIRDYDAYLDLLRGAGGPSPTPAADRDDSPSLAQEPSTPRESPSPASASASASASVSSSSSPAGAPEKSEGVLECKVCYKTFQNESVLRTHMRNHGMAFIRSKRSLSSD